MARGSTNEGTITKSNARCALEGLKTFLLLDTRERKPEVDEKIKDHIKTLTEYIEQK